MKEGATKLLLKPREALIWGRAGPGPAPDTQHHSVQSHGVQDLDCPGLQVPAQTQEEGTDPELDHRV